MKTDYRTMTFLEGEGAGGGGGGEVSGQTPSGGDSMGGAVFSPPGKMGTGDRPLPAEKMDKAIEHQDPQQGQGSERASTGFDPKEFAQEFGKTVAESLKTAKAGEEPKLTKEEAAKLLNLWEPDEQWYKDYDNLDTRAAAITRMRDGLMRQADTIAQLRLQEAIAELKGEFGPKLSLVEEQSNAQRETRFHNNFPQLSKPELQPIIAAVTNNLVSEGKSFTSEGEMFKAVANGVAAMIKATNPEFELETAGSTPANNAGRNRNAIPVTTPGAGGGAGGSASSSKPQAKRGLSIFE